MRGEILKNIRYCCYGLIVILLTLSVWLTIGDKAFNTNNSVNKSMVTSVNMLSAKMNTKEDVDLEKLLSTSLNNIAPASIVVKKSYDEMTIEERMAALYDGTLEMQYSAPYTYSGEGLSVSKGAQYYNGHKETYYSERVLPGTSLGIPGRHVADDGTIRDGDGFISVAADPSFLPKGSVLITSLGPAKVYDSGCSYGIVDLYVSW